MKSQYASLVMLSSTMTRIPSTYLSASACASAANGSGSPKRQWLNISA